MYQVHQLWHSCAHYLSMVRNLCIALITSAITRTRNTLLARVAGIIRPELKTKVKGVQGSANSQSVKISIIDSHAIR